MALEGTLRDFSLADIFQLIGLQRKTGVLTLRSKEDTVTVTFLDGKVVGADSLDRRLENRLGSVLIRTGYLSQDQLNRALEIQKETLQRLGFMVCCPTRKQGPERCAWPARARAGIGGVPPRGEGGQLRSDREPDEAERDGDPGDVSDRHERE